MAEPKWPESPELSTSPKEKGSKGKPEVRVFRHGLAQYQLDEGILRSEKPESKPEAKSQWFDSDLTPEGQILVREEAEKYFDTLDPQKDALFFVSSDLVRSAETARIFLDVARKRGFEILKPRKEDPRYTGFRNKAEEIGDGYIRKIDCLTLDHLENMLREKIFYQDTDYLKEVVECLENVSEETSAKWAEARAIIENDNKGSWGSNYYAHSDKIAKIFPDVKSAKEVYEKKFKRMLRLVKFAQKKIMEQSPEKNIKILGFSHENSFIYFLNEEFGESIKNCESVGFRIEEPEEGIEKPIEIVVEAKGSGRKFIETSENKWEL